MDFDWQNEGLMVDAEYYTFKKEISIISIYNLIKELLPEKYSPITGKNKVKANEGYLYELYQEIGVKLKKLTNIAFENQDVNKSFLDSLEYLEETSRDRLVTTRVGQGLYRRRILNRWKYKCAVSGLGITNILIASHIVPWRESNDKEKLDVDNGILLSPVYDALFDRYYISFNDNGDIVLSNNIKKSEFLKIGVNGNEKINNLSKGNIEYLKRHRKKLLK